jgi:prepilin-type N-terminal cleavage/methylation domain-containing protein
MGRMLVVQGFRVIHSAKRTLAPRGHPARGFTLVEVLVVLMIAALGVSLVAPSLINAYEGIKAAAEEQRLADILEAVTMKSFLRQTPYSLHFEENNMTIEGSDVIANFDYIVFSPVTIRFNGNGFADSKILKYVVREKKKELHVGA